MYHIIVNPASKSGRGIRIWEECQKVLNHRKVAYEVFFSEGYGQIQKKVQELTEHATERVDILVFGGDGTMNEVISGIKKLDMVRIGYIPSGSSNDLARDMKLTGKPSELIDKILNGNAGEPMDVGSLRFQHVGEEHSILYREDEFAKTKRFNVSCGIGFDAAVCEEALHSKLKETLNRMRLGKLVYLMIAVKQIIKARKVSCDLYLDDKEPIHLKRFLFVACMNHKYEGGGFMFGPDASYHDGSLDLCVVGNIPKALVFLALPTALKGKQFMFPYIDQYRAKKVRIRTSEPLWVHTDGEVYVKADDITVWCEDEQISMIM